MSDFNEKQVKIMEAAEIRFADKGFDGTSVRDIADTAGVNLAMINYYFGSKEKLMEAMFRWRSSYFTLQLETMVNNTAVDPRAKLDTLVDVYIDRLLNQECFHRIMIREQMVHGNPLIQQQLIRMKKINSELVRTLIAQGQDSGVFRKDVDVSMLIPTLVGTVGHVVSTQHYFKLTNNLEQMPDEEFRHHIRQKLSAHIKAIFKAILSNED